MLATAMINSNKAGFFIFVLLLLRAKLYRPGTNREAPSGDVSSPAAPFRENMHVDPSFQLCLAIFGL
jgi:hypothetical protein